MSSKQVAQVIYYLSRAGELEHPHSIDVAYSHSCGLLLKDLKRSLVAIRGNGMPDLYSWSYKRSYKDSFIWHDVSDNDQILPINNTEFILKGSEVVLKEGNTDLGEVQYKNVLKDSCLLTKSTTSVVKACKSIACSTDHSNDLLEQVEEQCRGEKPLPPCPVFTDRRILVPCPEKKATVISAETCLPKKPHLTNEVKPKRSAGSFIFRNMIPCVDVNVEANNVGLHNTGSKIRSFPKTKPGTGAKNPEVTKRQWVKHSSKMHCAEEDVKLLSSAGHEFISSRGSTPNNNLHGYSLPRYLPRYSFSNVGLDSYELRCEKVKDITDLSSSKPRFSAESLYEGEEFLKSREDDLFDSPQVISKLVQEAKARDDEKKGRSNDTKQASPEEEQFTFKTKLDWDKNLHEAVEMIIHPPRR